MSDPVALPISLPPSNLRPIAYRVLSKKHGLNIQSSALSTLAEYIGRQFGTEWRGPKTQLFLEQVASLWKEQDRGLFLDGENMASIITEITAKNTAAEKSTNQTKNNTNKKSSLDSIIAHRIDTIADEKQPSIIIHEDQGEVPNSQEIIPTPKSNQSSDNSQDTDKNVSLDWRDYYKPIISSHQPSYVYNVNRKQFEHVKSSENISSNSLLNLPKIKYGVDLFISRYHLIRNRLERNELFHSKAFSVTNSITGSVNLDENRQSITPIKNLLGSHGKRFLLFGLLTRNAVGLWQVQDETDAIELVLDQCLFPDYAYFTPGCFVLCDGIYSKSGKFYLSSIEHPPAERREKSIETYGNIDFLQMTYSIKDNFTGLTRVDKQVEKRLLSLERKLSDHRIIILGGDCHLNHLKTLEAIKKLFTKLTQELNDGEYRSPPITLIINGSFVDSAFDPAASHSSSSALPSSGIYKSYFDSLAAVVSKFPDISQRTNLILVPGDNDPWASTITKGSNAMWPQPRIPNVFGSRLNRAVQSITWVSNPSRLTYLGHEIVIVRDDIGARLRRNDISYLSKIDKDEITIDDDEDQSMINDDDDLTLTQPTTMTSDSDKAVLEIDKLNISTSQSSTATLNASSPRLSPEVVESRKLVKTILDQTHLSPFPTSIRPVLWNQDNCLSLNPLPTLLILTDTTSPQFDVTYEGCHVINPGSFLTRNKVSYIEYWPSTRKAVTKELYI